MIDFAGKPFFGDVEPARRDRQDLLEVHTSQEADGGRKPAVVFVHGGPVPEAQQPRPRDWEGFIGYGALAAASGLVGVTFNHRLHDLESSYPVAADDVAEAVEQTRALDSVDPDRIGLWFFSSGGGLAADWLVKRPDWLSCIAWTYPLLVPPPDWPGDRARFDTLAAASEAATLPKLLLRVGGEHEYFAQNQDDLVAAARAHDSTLDVIELPEAEHGFEYSGYDEPSRAAVDRAMRWVAGTLLG
ncbi:alpha/beta hydrolase family protein [Arthrobacter castelli]|uniref:alpha/beta hydrolase family protein n=1 Tax=Arthrobacter castelli TaxID=271431 RepID=UPI0003F9CC98|nr:dienelactone hydrolase family protein [Arthrobacter castelli]